MAADQRPPLWSGGRCRLLPLAPGRSLWHARYRRHFRSVGLHRAPVRNFPLSGSACKAELKLVARFSRSRYIQRAERNVPKGKTTTNETTSRLRSGRSCCLEDAIETRTKRNRARVSWHRRQYDDEGTTMADRVDPAAIGGLPIRQQEHDFFVLVGDWFNANRSPSVWYCDPLPFIS